MGGFSGVSLGASMFMTWEDLDAALDKWAKEYFGDHVKAEGSRDEDAFELALDHLKPSDYEKYERLFDLYDDEQDYEPDEEFETGHYTLLPSSVTRRLMVEVLGQNGLGSYGTALATYAGVYFMEQDRFAEKRLDVMLDEAKQSVALQENNAKSVVPMEGEFEF